MYNIEKQTLEALHIAHHEADERYVSHRVCHNLALRLLELEEEEHWSDAITIRGALRVLLQDLLWDAMRESGEGVSGRDADMKRLANQLGLMLDTIGHAEVAH